MTLATGLYISIDAHFSRAKIVIYQIIAGVGGGILLTTGLYNRTIACFYIVLSRPYGLPYRNEGKLDAWRIDIEEGGCVFHSLVDYVMVSKRLFSEYLISSVLIREISRLCLVVKKMISQESFNSVLHSHSWMILFNLIIPGTSPYEYLMVDR